MFTAGLLLLLKEAFNRKLFSAESNYLKNIEAVMAFKKSCGHTIKFATLNIPRAIIQAVIICVYCFGMITLMARNFKDRHHASDVFISYIPLMPGLQVSRDNKWSIFILKIENEGILEIRILVFCILGFS